MELIIGGAYQGKGRYAQEKLGVDDIFSCAQDQTDLPFDRSCIADLERYALACVRAGKSSVAYLRAHRDLWTHCIFIADDISAGVVPVDPEMRAWREETGRLLAYLAGEATHVHRVFCGIGAVIK